MSGAPSSKKRRLAAGAVVVLAGLALWLVLRPNQPAAPPDEGDEAQPHAAAEAPRRLPAPPPPAPTPPRPPAPTEEHVADDGLPIMPAEPDAARPEGPVHPHPITEKHKRIYAENRLIGGLNGAVDARDAAGIRRLLSEYRRDYPEDEHDVQEGYQVIADCLEHPGEAARAAARRFGEEHRGSTTRRFVDRICLDGQ